MIRDNALYVRLYSARAAQQLSNAHQAQQHSNEIKKVMSSIESAIKEAKTKIYVNCAITSLTEDMLVNLGYEVRVNHEVELTTIKF